MNRSQRPFRFGVINETPLPEGGWAAHVARIEDLGYDTFLIRDHLAPDFFGPQLGPIAALATAAAITRHLRVGSMVFNNDFRHPAVLAKELAAIDHLSGGRLEVGLGAGWLEVEYKQAGLTYDRAGKRIERLAEAVRVLKACFASGVVACPGEHYSLNGLQPFPAPVQRPGPPLLIGGGRRRVLELAGREADIVGVLNTSVATGTVVASAAERLPAAVEEKLGWVRQGAGERFSELELSLIPTIVITAEPRQACEALIAQRGWADVGVEQVLEMPSVLIGPTELLVEEMVRRRDRYGFSYYAVSDRQAEDFAGVVAALSGR